MSVSILLGLFLVLVAPIVSRKINSLGSGYGPVKTYYDVIGTTDSSTTTVTAVNLNTNYASTTGQFLATNMETISLNLTYTVASTSNLLYMLVEVSNDNGATFYPLSKLTQFSTSTGVFIEAQDGSIGLPFIFPGDSSVSTTLTYKAAITLTDVVADYVKISAKSANSTTSTLKVRAITTSK